MIKTNILLLTLFISSCNVADKGNEPKHDEVAKQDQKQACLKAGNKWIRGGFVGLYHCVKTYSDGGKLCTSSSQCEGNCISTGYPEKRAMCAKNNSPFGCFSKVEELKKTGGAVLCRD